MADLFLINPGDYIDFLRKLNISEDRESSFNKDQHAARFLTLLFDQINRPINAVLEEYYIDDDYLDLYSNYYAFSYQENTKFSKRVLLLDCSFADCNQFYNYWYSASENELSKKVLAVFVIPDSSNKHISKAYIDPNILLNKPYSKIILSSIKIDILGKRIHINVFPFRQTDSELLTYSEVSIQGVFDYYYNMNKGFNKVYLSSLLNTKQELSKIRGLYHGNGMDVRDICSVFRQKGFETIYCDINTTSLGYARVDKSKMLINTIYPYVASGYPCLLHVNFGPGQDYLGHCVNIIGVVEKSNYCINEKTVLRLIGPGEYNYDIIQDSEFCSEIITVDDQTCLNYFRISDGSTTLNRIYQTVGTVIAVPLSIKMTAIDAFSVACKLIGDIPFVALIPDINKERLIISIFLAKSADYVRYRVKNANELSEKKFYVEYLMPEYVWLCEYSTLDLYSKRLVEGELVLDATSLNLYNSVVLFRYRNRILNSVEKEILGVNFDKLFKIYEPYSIYHYS